MKKIIKISLFTILLFIGILIGRFIKDWPLFTIDYNLSITHLASIFTTIFIAILVSYYIDNAKHDNRKEKELIIKRVDDVYQLIENISSKIEDGSISYQQAASKVKRINMGFLNVFEILNSSKIKIKQDNKTDFLEKIKILRDLLTKTPIITKKQLIDVDLPIEVKDGVIRYTESRIAEIETLFEGIKGQLVDLQLKINKS